jgi:hypothetical protein
MVTPMNVKLSSRLRSIDPSPPNFDLRTLRDPFILKIQGKS